MQQMQSMSVVSAIVPKSYKNPFNCCIYFKSWNHTAAQTTNQHLQQAKVSEPIDIASLLVKESMTVGIRTEMRETVCHGLQ